MGSAWSGLRKEYLSPKRCSLLRFGKLGKAWRVPVTARHPHSWVLQCQMGTAGLSCSVPCVAILVPFMKGFIKAVNILTDLFVTILRCDLLAGCGGINSKKRYFFVSKFFNSLQSLTVSSPGWDKLQRRCYPCMNLEELCLGWVRKYCLYNQRAQNWRHPKLGQRLWYVFEFSALLALTTPPCFLRLGYVHSTKILFFDLTFADLTISRCVFPDDIFATGIHGQRVLSVHKFSPVHILFLHSVQVKAPRPSINNRVRDFIKRAAVPGRCNFSSQERTVV